MATLQGQHLPVPGHKTLQTSRGTGGAGKGSVACQRTIFRTRQDFRPRRNSCALTPGLLVLTLSREQTQPSPAR